MNDVDRVVTDEYERYKPEVLRTVASKLGTAGAKVDPRDLEAPYNEAWHALYIKMSDGEEIGNRVGFLVTVTHRRAVSEYRGYRTGRRAEGVDLDLVGAEEDLDAQMDAQIKVRHVVEGLRANLSEREFEAATLCHLHGYSRPEAAEAIGVKPKRMEKIMDGASDRIATVIEKVRAGEHCEAMSSQVRAYAVGLLDPEGDRYSQTENHLKHCPACRRQVWVLRGLAAGLPPIPAVALLAGSGGTTGGIAASGMASHSAKGPIRPGKGNTRSSGGSGTVAAVAAGVAVVAVAVAATFTVLNQDGSGEPASTSSSASGGGNPSSSQADASSRRMARAKVISKTRKKQRQKREAQQPKAGKAQEAVPATIPEPAPVYIPPPPETTYVPPPEPQPAPPPVEPPVPQPEPPTKPTRPTKNAGDEFGLR